MRRSVPLAARLGETVVQRVIVRPLLKPERYFISNSNGSNSQVATSSSSRKCHH